MEEEKRIEDELSYPILLCERVRSTVKESALSFTADCTKIGIQTEVIAASLRSLVRVSAAYDRPIRRVSAEASKNLSRALTLVRKCSRRKRNLLRRVFTIVTAADFRKVLSLLDASVADLAWLSNILTAVDGGGGGIDLSLPPIASNDPMVAWVWSAIISLQLAPVSEKIEAANQLTSLAHDSDRNKQIIVEEKGVGPLLKLLKEDGSVEARVSSLNALIELANEQERVRMIVSESGVGVVVSVLSDSPVKVQTLAARLVGRMAENDPLAREDFARENAIRPLVTLLSLETFVGDDQQVVQFGKQSIHTVLRMNRERERNGSWDRHSLNSSFSSFHSDGGSSRGASYRKEREKESPQVKHAVKVSCAEALWMLAKGSVANSKRITETKGLLCLARLVEKEVGDLEYNCLMTIMEITSSAESNADLRRAAFKTNSPAAKAVVDQLLRVIKDLDSPKLLVPAIKSIGSLARTFPARETRVIGPLVLQLSSKNHQVAAEAATALGKFASPENFLCNEHAKSVIEFNGVPPLVKLLRVSGTAQSSSLTLLCYLALHVGNNEALQQSRLLTILEGADKTVLAQNPELRELVSKATYHLNLYHPGSHSQTLSFVP